MQTTEKERAVTTHDLARLLYVQGLIVHRRVLIVGADLDLAKFAIESHARYVCAVCERDPKQAWPERSDSSNMELRVTRLDDLGFRDSSFDLAIVPDLTDLPNQTAVLNELRRAVGSRGYVIAAAPNPACEESMSPGGGSAKLDYYEMYDLLGGIFPSVQMIGQSAFVGYAVADLACDEADPQVSFDSTLAGENVGEIEWFIAVCGDRAAMLDPYAVIQIPTHEAQLGKGAKEELNAAKSKLDSLQNEREALSREIEHQKDQILALETRSERIFGLEEEIKRAKLELSNRGVRIGTLENDLEKERYEAEAARARAVQIAKQFDDERKAAQKKQLEEEISKRSADIDLQEKLRQSEIQTRRAEERARSAEQGRDEMVERLRGDAAELDRIRERQERLETESERLAARERALQEETNRLKRSLEEAERKAADAEADRTRLSSLEGEIDRDRDAFGREISALETSLKNLAQELSEAKADVARYKEMVRDLVADLEEREKSALDLIEQKEEMEVEIASLRGTSVGQNRARVEAELALATAEMKIQRLNDELSAIAWKLAEKDEGKKKTAAAGDFDVRELKQAKEQIAVLEEEVAALKGTSAGQNRARVEAELALATAEMKIQRLNDELTSFAWKPEIQDDLLERDKRIARLEGDLQTARWHASEIEAQNSDMAKTVEELTRNKSTAERSAVMFEEEAGHQRARTESLKNDLAAAKERMETLEKEIEHKAGDRIHLENELAKQSRRLRELEQRAAKAERDAGESSSIQKIAEQRFNSANKELEGARAMIASLKSALKENESKRLESPIPGLTAEIESLKARLEDESKRNKELEASVKILSSEKSDELLRTRAAGSDAARLAGMNEDLAGKLERKEKELAEREASCEADERALATLKAEIVELSGKLDESREALAAERSKSKALAEEAGRKENQTTLIESLTTQLQERERRATKLEKEAREMRQQIKDHESDVSAWETEIKFRNSRISQLEAEVAKLKQSRAVETKKPEP